ncbi:MAG TPA: hypothetical protein VH681_09800 [Nitrospiraceae bacterium]|jgi:hypothetical protein
MSRRFRSSLVVLLIVCIIGVSGVAAAQAVVHEGHHAHHQAATHGTILCSWMCAAGQVHDGSTAPYLTEQAPVLLSDHTTFSFIPHIALDNTTSRGPPSLS